MDLKPGDIIRVETETHHVPVSHHLLMVTKTRSGNVYAKYLHRNDTRYGEAVVNFDQPIEIQNGLVLDSRCVKKI